MKHGDLSGREFGRWAVLKPSSTKKHYYVCKCSCSSKTIKDVSKYELIRGRANSCGCSAREKTSKRSKLDLTNVKFGRLQAVKSVGKDARGNIMWRCRCACGNTKNVAAVVLRRGVTRSCGCLRSDVRVKDMVGQKFGALTALHPVDRKETKTSKTPVRWLCQCDCGKEIKVSGARLRSQPNISCGCLIRKRSQIRIESLVGRKFGKLTVVRSTGKKGNDGRLIYECKCDCGNMHFSNRNQLVCKSMGCGCGYAEAAKARTVQIKIPGTGSTITREELARISGMSKQQVTDRLRSNWSVAEIIVGKRNKKKEKRK